MLNLEKCETIRRIFAIRGINYSLRSIRELEEKNTNKGYTERADTNLFHGARVGCIACARSRTQYDKYGKQSVAPRKYSGISRTDYGICRTEFVNARTQ